jgi:AcrR family transcriptional regulator
MNSRRNEIKKAAARLFRKRGFKATSMRDIAEAVGIKAASIYNHINSKQELLNELLLEIATIFTKEMAEIQASNLGTKQKLERIIAVHVRLTIEHTDAIALVSGEWIHLEYNLKTEYLALRDD